MDNNRSEVEGEPYGDGDGTPEHPIVINHTTTARGVPAEYAYIRRHFGVQGTDWECGPQMLTTLNRRMIDVILIKLPGGREREIHFDITNFYGK